MQVAQFNRSPGALLDPRLGAVRRCAPVTNCAPAAGREPPSLRGLRVAGWRRAPLRSSSMVCSTPPPPPLLRQHSEGNIGPVLDALADRLDAGSVIVCPLFRRTGEACIRAILFRSPTACLNR